MPQPVAATAASSDARLRVLLVEDSETARAIVRDLLAVEEPTLELDEAEDLESAVRALAERSYDCALVDYELPDGHGLALLGASEDEEGPAPAMVNAVNTPIAYSATSRSTLASVTRSRASATTESVMIPLEKASRCPRRVNCRGRNW